MTKSENISFSIKLPVEYDSFGLPFHLIAKLANQEVVKSYKLKY